MNDLISRQAAIDIVRYECGEWTGLAKEIVKQFSGLPSAQQDCAECPEYDHEAHSCPKYCETIRKTLKEAKQERTGRWELIDDTEFRIPGYRCSVCHCECEDWDKKPTYRFCPNCGARLEGEG